MPRPPLPTAASPWLNRLLTTLLAALVAASAVYWVLTWPTPTSTPRPTIGNDEAPAIDPDKIAHLLGAGKEPIETETATPSVSSNFKLVGVIAQGGAGSHGSALIAVAGGPAKPYRVGQVVGDDLVLQTVKPRRAELGPKDGNRASVTLELPAPK